MKTKLAPTLAVLGLSLVLAGCNKPASQNPGQSTGKSEIKSDTFSEKSTLKNLLGLGKNLTCTYSFVDNESKFQVNGTTYISGKKFASEVETVDAADERKNIKSFMYSDGDYIYTWSPDKKGYGMKIKIEAPVEGDKTTKTDVAGAQDTMEKEYDMKCSPWSIDQSKFTLPSDVQFTDLSEMMKKVPAMPSIPALPK